MKISVLFCFFLLQSVYYYSEGQSEPQVERDSNSSVQFPVKVLNTPSGSCPSHQDVVNVINEIHQSISDFLMSRTYSCDGTLGWRRVGYLDMTDPSQSCPPGLALKNYGLRTCGQVTNSPTGCSSTFYETGDFFYNKVCGRVRGYQYGFMNAFSGALMYDQDIDGNYVSGVSLTHGQSGRRTHIWTFATGLSETYTGLSFEAYCPCVRPETISPAFVGNDYFCESGAGYFSVRIDGRRLFASDPLWDGCNTGSSSCQLNETSPYFTKTLPAATSDDIELRICNVFRDDGDSPIDQIELYVQ